MTSPRPSYGGGYHPAPSFADTPIYDSLVAERGTPQIAPIRVPPPYDAGNQLPALPSALPALPPAPSHHTPAHGYPAAAAPAPHIPQQVAGPRGYPGAVPHQPQTVGGTGYEAMRPAAPRPVPPPAPRPAPAPYED